MVPPDQNLWTFLPELVPTRAAFASNLHESYSLGTQSMSCVVGLPTCARYTHISGRGHRGIRDYRITSIFRYLRRHSRHDDAASGTFLALLNSNDIKVNSLLRKGRCASPSESAGRFRGSVFRMQFRRTLNCLNEKSFL